MLKRVSLIGVRRLVLLITMVFALLTFAGCSMENLYDDVSSDITLQEIADEEYGTDDYRFTERYLNWCISVKWYAPFVICGSMIIGILLMAIFRAEKNISKVGLYVFIVGIPLITFIAVYLMCYMYEHFF